MVAIPKTVEKRIRDGIKKYKNVLKAAKDKDINEADTVTIVIGMLADICGYDRFLDITKEYAVKNIFCDIAIKLEEKIIFLIEVKAIGIAQKNHHLDQAITYAAKSGTDWIILTNGDQWQVHKVIFGKPVQTEMVFDFSFLESDKIATLIDYFFLLGKEGVKKSPPLIQSYHEERQITSRYTIAQIIQKEPFISLIKKQLKSFAKSKGIAINVSDEDILDTLKTQILKREVIGGEDTKKPGHLNFGIIKAAQSKKPDKGSISVPMQGKDDLRYQFWTQLLALAEKKTDLHAKIKPTKYDWLGRRIHGLWFNYSVGQHQSRAELWIDKGKDAEAENNEIFDRLVANKAEIEQTFGGPLEWERLDGKRACRIRKQITLGGYLDEKNWPKIHEEMADAMVRLHTALSPHIEYLKK
jgi:predicted type IV restriction endonuclease